MERYSKAMYYCPKCMGMVEGKIKDTEVFSKLKRRLFSEDKKEIICEFCETSLQ